MKVFIGIVFTLPLIAMPSLGIVPWQVTWPLAWDWDGRYLHALTRILCAIAAAIFFSRSLAKTFCPTADLKFDPLGTGTRRLIDCVFIVAIPALVVGWQATPAITVVAVLLAAIPLWRSRRQSFLSTRLAIDPFAAFAMAMPLALTLQLMLWRPLHQASFWPSIDSPPWLILGVSAFALVLPSLLLRLPNRNAVESEAIDNAAIDEDEE